MEAPTPKHEIVVIPPQHGGRLCVLQVWTASADARSWVEQEAPKYGRVCEEPGYLQVWVSPNFDADEVAHYLTNGYNEQQA